MTTLAIDVNCPACGSHHLTTTPADTTTNVARTHITCRACKHQTIATVTLRPARTHERTARRTA